MSDVAAAAESAAWNVFGNFVKSIDDWQSSGWQVRKRAGQWIPEVRPNPKNTEAIAERAAQGADAGLALPSAKEGLALTAPDDAQLVKDFATFLECSDVDIDAQGKILVSKEEISSLVAQFTHGKLKVLAASARALARYVQDLEDELEVADDEVVKLRNDFKREQRALALKQSEVEELKFQRDSVTDSLQAAREDLARKEAAQVSLEKQAEAAAKQQSKLLGKLKSEKAASKANEPKMRGISQKAIDLEEQLMAAEEMVEQRVEAEKALQAKLLAIEAEQKRAVQQRGESESALERALQRASVAEQEAQAKAQELESYMQRAEVEADQARRQISVMEERLTTTAASSPSDATSFEDEAQMLRDELMASLPADVVGSSGGPARPPALSRMRKVDLVAECKERQIDSQGSVPELRVRLRVARKDDKLGK